MPSRITRSRKTREVVNNILLFRSLSATSPVGMASFVEGPDRIGGKELRR